MLASSRTVKLVEPPGTTVSAKLLTTLNPAGTLSDAVSSVRSPVPLLLIVKVCSTAVPSGVLPKSTLPEPSAISDHDASTTSISGSNAAPTSPLRKKSKGSSSVSLLPKDIGPP